MDTFINDMMPFGFIIGIFVIWGYFSVQIARDRKRDRDANERRAIEEELRKGSR